MLMVVFRKAVKNVNEDHLILDEDERWEKMFRKDLNQMNDEIIQPKNVQDEIERLRSELAEKQKLLKEKKNKKDKKHKKKHKKDKKRKEKKEKKEKHKED
jgi:hypothetical protein